MAIRVQADFDGDPRSVHAAREFVAATLAAWDLDDLAEVATLCTSEVATNAVRHANTAFRLAMEARASEILFEVEDHGGGDPLPTLPSEDSEGGRGLWLVAALSARWGCERLSDGGKVVWFSLPSIPLAGT